MRYVYSDGGRTAAGYKGDTHGDCVCRAIAIVSQKPYQEVYEALNAVAKNERVDPRRGDRSSARNGVYRKTYDKYLTSLGFEWEPTMFVGSGCRIHLREEELPKNCRLIVSVSKHLTAVINGVIYDTHNPQRGGTRCVYGYWRAP